MTPEQIEAMSVIELKALVYDQLAQTQATQKNIEVLNQIIARKSQPVKLQETNA